LPEALIVLQFLPNARYLYPSLPLMLVPLAALLGWLAPDGLQTRADCLAVVCVAFNAWFLPASNFYHGDFYERAPLSLAMRQPYMHQVRTHARDRPIHEPRTSGIPCSAGRG
jgi:hypothetical protein